EIEHSLSEVGPVDVGVEVEGEIALAVVLQGLVRHHRTKVGAADADVDDVAYAFGGVTLPAAAADEVTESAHGIEHGVDFRHDVFTVHQDGCALGRAQGNVQDGTVLRDVDLVAAEHGFEPVAQTGLLREIEEELQGFASDAVLRVVEVEAEGFDGQMFAAGSVVREQLTELQVSHLLVMCSERFPGSAFGDSGASGWFDASCHAS